MQKCYLPLLYGESSYARAAFVPPFILTLTLPCIVLTTLLASLHVLFFFFTTPQGKFVSTYGPVVKEVSNDIFNELRDYFEEERERDR